MDDKNSNKDIIEQCLEKNKFYVFFNNDFCKEFTDELKQTPWRDKESEKSLTFDCSSTDWPDNDKNCKKLIRIFGIQETKLFEEKFKNEAVQGSGNEGHKIMTMHSSSLLSFLCFYGVGPKKIQIPIDVEGLPKQLSFNRSQFEVQNDVTHAYCGKDNFVSSHPSNIDVVLYSNDGRYELFLESKFSEYLKNGLVSGISTAVYRDIYEKLNDKLCDTFFTKAGLEFVNEKDEDGNDKNTLKLRAQQGNTHQYLKGIKQMISHFMAVCSYAYRKKILIEKKNPKEEPPTIILGTILYHFNDNEAIEKFNKYSKLYGMLINSLRKILNQYKIDNLKLLDTPLTYQQVFGNGINDKFLDENVAAYYKL